MTSSNINKTAITLSFITLTLVSSPALSGSWNWLENSPAEAFTDSDWAMLKQTARATLEHGEDGNTATWVNQDTGHSGSITPLSTFDNNGMLCRKAKFFNSADKMTGSSIFRLCKQEDGKWKVTN